jgi:hypothetical protein
MTARPPNKVLLEIYEDFMPNKIYTSFLCKRQPQTCIIDFETWKSKPDKFWHADQNVHIHAICIAMKSEVETYNSKKEFLLIAPQRTFAKMFKYAGIKVIEEIEKKSKCYIKFMIVKQHYYKLMDYRFLK